MSETPTPRSARMDADILVGGDILDLITCGMYASPLAIYREYLQNAADSIASTGHPEKGRVEIEIAPAEMGVTIRDNGPGLSPKKAVQALIPIARSNKQPRHDRGFRGVGRLVGLAFGRSVQFLTRSDVRSPVTRVTWNGEQLRSGINKKLPIEEIVPQCVSVEHLKEEDCPDNFFEVRVEGISRYAASLVLNRDVVRGYLGEVCPVPFNGDFPYASQFSHLFNGTRPLALDVRFTGEAIPVTRPHKNVLLFSESRLDEFSEFEKIEVPALGGEGYAAVGWIAHSSYLGALPKKLAMGGLRARVGNIQIGSETVFDHLFSENRFNRWCVAEIHVLDPRIVPNGRRDYFESSAHLRNLENHLGAVCRRLEHRCRAASRKRNRQRRVQLFIEEMEAAYMLINCGYLAARSARKFAQEKLFDITAFREKYKDIISVDDDKRLARIEKKFTSRLRSPSKTKRSLNGVAPSHLPAYRKIFGILIERASSPHQAKEAIETILKNH